MNERTGTRRSSAAPTPSGCSTMTTTPSESLGSVLEELRRSRLPDQSTHRMTELLVRFTIFLNRGLRLGSVKQISADHVNQFIRAGISTPTGRHCPGVATMHLRRS